MSSIQKMATAPFQRGSLVLNRLYTRPPKLRTKLFHCQFPLQLQCRTLATSLGDAAAVRIMEVGPRDGLQNIKQSIPTPIKVELIQRLASAGLRNIEATSFVSPKWVPQLADGATVMSQILPMVQQSHISFPVLAPNMKGLENAIKSGAKEVVVFASATEAFSKKNQNCTVEEALGQAQEVAESALSQGIAVRG